MKQEVSLSNTFWWGVINYFRVSAATAETPEALNCVMPEERVFVFKTSVKDADGLAGISDKLNERVGTGKWTIDLEDEDKVLRVTGPGYLDEEVIKVFNQAGLECELMPY